MFSPVASSLKDYNNGQRSSDSDSYLEPCDALGWVKDRWAAKVRSVSNVGVLCVVNDVGACGAVVVEAAV